MRFWDTSALVPLLVQEKATPWAESLLSQDPEMVVFWLAEAVVEQVGFPVEKPTPFW